MLSLLHLKSHCHRLQPPHAVGNLLVGESQVASHRSTSSGILFRCAVDEGHLALVWMERHLLAFQHSDVRLYRLVVGIIEHHLSVME